MGIKKFSKQMFKLAMKDSFSYVLSVAVTVMLVFAMVNISFNKIIYGTLTSETVMVWEVVGLGCVLVETTVGAIQQELVMMSIMIVTVFTIMGNNSFLKRRLKELSFIVMNGATISEMSYYIRYMCSRIFLIASFLGVILGVIFAPLFNFIMYKLVGVDGQIFLYYKETFTVIFSFAFVNYMYLMIASAAYVYRKQVDELMTEDREKNVKDNRQLKIPKVLYLITYLMPLLIIFIPESYGNINGFITVGIYIMAVASIGVILLYLPEKLKDFNKSKFMYHKERKIFINNAFMKLKHTIIYIVGMILAINYFLDKILEFREHESIVAILLFSMLLCTIIIAVSLANKIIDDCGIGESFYKDLSAMGYSKMELFRISLKENRLTSLSIFMFLLPPFIFGMIMHVGNQSLEMSLLVALSVLILCPIVVSGIISYEVNKHNLYKILNIERSEVRSNKGIIKSFNTSNKKDSMSEFSKDKKVS
ncbi:MAG: hypothetical protein ACRCWM_06485 [Sarcina sp.]